MTLPLKRAVKKSEEIAEFSPENKEYMPPLGEQRYLNGIIILLKTENFRRAKIR